MTAEKSANKDQKSIRLNENSSNALKIHNPCHRKIYVPMITDDDVKVGMKEILQHPTKLPDGIITYRQKRITTVSEWGFDIF